MSYQYLFCPACHTRRAAYNLQCSVCGGLMRRTPIASHISPAVLRQPVSWPSTFQTTVTAEKDRELVAA